MKNFQKFLTLLCALSLFFVYSCEKDSNEIAEGAISSKVITQIENMGFSTDGIVKVEEGYRVERDIILRESDLVNVPTVKSVPHAEQYSTNNLVSTGGSRVISVYIPTSCSTSNSTSDSNGNGNGNAKGGKPGGGNGGGGGGGASFDCDYVAALNDAIGRFNAEGLEISFERVLDAAGADITFTRLKKGDERQGILGSAGFPSGGNPYNEIKMSGIIISNFGWSVGALATVMAHEMGHCIGFRHTDYFDRSISCGGSPSNEGPAEPIGANHIPGTPTGASASAKSWMLSCTGNESRPFNNDDKTALDYLY